MTCTCDHPTFEFLGHNQGIRCVLCGATWSRIRIARGGSTTYSYLVRTAETRPSANAAPRWLPVDLLDDPPIPPKA